MARRTPVFRAISHVRSASGLAASRPGTKLAWSFGVPSPARIPAFVNVRAANVDEVCGVLERAGGFDVRRIAPSALVDEVGLAASAGVERVAVAGGDGTIGTAAGALCGTSTALAVLPTGTLNHLARALGIPESLDDAAQIAKGSHRRTVDVAFVNGRIFLNTSSVGAYVGFVQRRDSLERWMGYRLASLVAGVWLLRRLRTFRVTVDAEGESREYETPLVFVGVAERELKLPVLGARVPGGRRGLHVMVLRTRSGARTLALALAAMARGVSAVARTPAMDAFLVDRLRIEPRRPMPEWFIALDGEIVRVAPPLDYRVARDGLAVVAAPPSARSGNEAPGTAERVPS